jgi:hypothetical protein
VKVARFFRKGHKSSSGQEDAVGIMMGVCNVFHGPKGKKKISQSPMLENQHLGALCGRGSKKDGSHPQSFSFTEGKVVQEAAQAS